MVPVIYGICEKCRKRIPATHVKRDGKVYISKHCPDCGTTEALVSSDAAVWQHKREVWGYDPAAIHECSIDCRSCGHNHLARLLFLDVTNRCNMNCPICIANIPGMGFEFHPPMAYFEKVADALAAFDPRPSVMLFGGEPTVRDDLFEIIDLFRARKLPVRIVTNGLKLADPDYCRRICENKAPVFIAFDGHDPDIYVRLRKSASAYDKKLQALENLKKFSTRRNTIMVCLARGINDKHMADLIRYCHENRATFGGLHLIPLAESWEEGEFEAEAPTSIEDVEKIIAEAMPDEKVEFIPAGLIQAFHRAVNLFGSWNPTFRGIHPNCESMTMLFSDGERYHALGYYLKRPLNDLAADLVRRARRIEPRLARLDPARWAQRWQARLLVLHALGWPLLRALNLRRLLKHSLPGTLARILRDLWDTRFIQTRRRRLKKHRRLLRSYLNAQEYLTMVVLPFEEYHSIDGARLQNCTVSFVYEDPDTGEVRTMPVCAWSLYRKDIQRKIAEKYAAEPAVR